MNNKKSTVISFRLSTQEFEPYALLLDKSSMSRSEFFRTIFLEHKIDIKLKEKVSPDYKKCLFYYNKTSNNMNQLAMKINRAYADNTISEVQFKKLLNSLIDIRNLLQGTLNVS